MQADMNIGMLGHVDHGKTTLTQALTGKWTDTHSEELKRGISIRLGYADAHIYKNKNKLSTDPKDGKLHRKFSIVDAPGHEILMTTVISATSILDGVLFLIAANEPCPQPQTAEHLLVLNSTGIKKIIVVQTKVDIVSKEQAMENYQQIKKFLKGTVAENAPIIPVSAHNNLNMDALLETIDNVMVPPEFDEKAKFRMYVSRSFDINRPGTEIKKLKGGVIGGSIVQGVLKLGDEIEIKPGISKREGARPETVVTKVIALREENDDLKVAKAGGLVAVATDIDPSLTKADSFVGSIVGKKGEVPEAVSEIKMEYILLKRQEGQIPLQVNEPVVVNIHTSTGVGLITKLHKGTATVRLKKPSVVYPGMHAALSKRVGQKWKLSAWGKII